MYWVFINLPISKVDKEFFQLEVFSEEYLIEVYARHLRSEYQDVLENTLWFMCVIVQESVVCRDKIISSKIFGEVMKILRKDVNSVQLIEFAVWFLSSLMKITVTTPPEIKISECLEASAGYLHTTEHIIITQSMWTIYNISQHDENLPNLYKEIMNSGAVVKILKYNYNRLKMCLIPCIRILGNLCAGRFEIVDVLINHLTYFLGFIKIEYS